MALPRRSTALRSSSQCAGTRMDSHSVTAGCGVGVEDV